MLPHNRVNIDASILLNGKTLRLEALIDSGSDSNLLDSQFVKQTLINTLSVDTPLVVNALNDDVLAHITHQAFHVMFSPHAPLVCLDSRSTIWSLTGQQVK